MFQLENIEYKNILSIQKLHIKKEKLTSIIGESGVGKSTLLKLLNHLESFDKGDILYKGESLNKIDPIELRREVTMLSQTPAIFDGTIKDNLAIGCYFAGKPEPSEDTMTSALNVVYLNKALNVEAIDLSGGEKQRLALARMVLIDPPALLLDEPTSALDAETADTVIKQFLEWGLEKKKTIVMVTHSNAIAEKYSDEIIKLHPHTEPEVIKA